jgi:CRISPR/Cas system-associated exonuclease Cas4 (RecB family)
MDRMTKDGLDTLATFIDDAPPALMPAYRTTVQNYATCPLMGWLLENRRVIDSSTDTASGSEAHDAFSEVVAEYVASGGEMNRGEIGDMLVGYLRQSRPDVQPLVIESVKRSVYEWSQFIHGITASNILRFDGGKGSRTGQIGKDVPHLGLCATTELDFLHAGPAKEMLHIVDWKTGRYMHTAADVKESFQFAYQAWLTLENYPDVQAVEVRVWNTRLNRLTYGVEFLRNDLPAIEQRMIKSLSIYAQHTVAESPEKIPAWPTAEKCGECRASIFCHATPPNEVENDPVAFLLAMHAQEQRLKAMKKAAAAYVTRTAQDIVTGDGSLCFGFDKPSSERRTATIYTPKGE